MKKYTIDAKGRAPGRIATEVAVLLMGKNRTDFARNTIPEVQVEVVSASEMRITEKKKAEKTYSHHSGYPGGLKTHSMKHVIATKGGKEVLRRAIYGMLPKNKLRPRMMTHLKIKD
jgi:large subunit ribosomal protein L13